MTSHLPRVRSVRRALAVPVLAVALLSVSSCGDDTVPVAADTGSALEPGDEISSDDLADRLADAVELAKEAGTAHVSLEAGGGKPGLSGEGVLDYGGDTVDAALTVESELVGGTADLRMVGGVMYLKIPMFGDKFVEIDGSDSGNPFGEMLGGPLDLDSMLDGLQDAVTKATYVGEDDVAGESLAHYAVEIDPAELVDGAEHLGKLADGKTLELDLWFDGEDYLRKVAVDAPAVGAVELSLSEWGSDVTVEAPPADQVTDFGTQFSRLAG